MNKKIILALALVLLFAGFSSAISINASGLYKRTETNCCPQAVRTSCDDPCANNSPPIARIVTEQPRCGGCDNLTYTWGYERWQCKMNPVKRVIESYEIEEAIYTDAARAACCGMTRVMEINHSCGTRGCNAATGKCNDLQPTLEFAWKCDPSSNNYKVKVEKKSGNIYEKVFCKYGCSNGECNNAPRATIDITIDYTVKQPQATGYEFKCSWFLFGGWKSERKNLATGKKTYTDCGSLGCNKDTGLCNTKTVSNTTTSNTYCKQGVSDKTFVKFIYSNGSTSEFVREQCGSCQHCSNGQCVPNSGSSASGSGCTVNVNIYGNSGSVSGNSSSGTSGSNYPVSYSYNGPSGTVNVNPARNENTGSVLSAGITLTRRVYSVSGASSTAYFAATSRTGLRSDYKQIYQPSSTWTCNGSSKVPVDSSGNKIWNKAEYCALGCFNGSCVDAQDMCTYNSDCPSGYRCAKLSTVNACVPEGY